MNKSFFKRFKKHLIVLGATIFTVFVSMGIANGVQNNWGQVEIINRYFDNNYPNKKGEIVSGKIAYKMYKPKAASKTNKMPGVLLLHGYQNDHETNSAYAIELARRGVVVMSIDEYGHGATTISMLNRGYTNHKVTTNYGNDVDGKTYLTIKGAERYKVLMNFSNLDFFIDKYAKGTDGSQLLDTSMGGKAAYGVLATQFNFVDNTRLAISGHSMGTWASWSTAAAYSGATLNGADIMPKATVLQAGELFRKSAYDSNKIKFNNVLLLTAKYDEFNYFRDYSKQTVNDSIINTDLTREFLGIEDPNVKAEWNTTYNEDFAKGTSRRRQLVNTNHRLITHNNTAIATALDWFKNSIRFDSNLSSSNQIFMAKECLTLLATLSAIVAMFPLMLMLIKIPFFEEVNQSEIIPIRIRYAKRGWKWWRGALITMGISCITFPFMTQLGHGLLPLPEKSLFRMTIGNGFLAWYLLLILIMLGTTIIPYLIKRRKDKTYKLNFVSMGLSKGDHVNKLDWKLFGKGALVAFIMGIFMYILCIICEAAFSLDFRFIWPFFKGFSWIRLAQFFVYLPFFIVFFVLNNSKIFASQINRDMANPGFVGFMKSWWKCALMMVGGILIIVLIEYIPFFAGAGPGIDLLFSSTFGGPFMSILLVFVPQVVVFSFICTYCYRKTGNVYVGATLVAMMATWIITGGSSML